MRRTLAIVSIVVASCVIGAGAQEPPFEVHNREIFMGRPAIWTGVYDFYLDPKDAQVRVRKLMASEIGNPGQIFLRRAGPDNVAYDHFPPEAILVGQNIGHIAWQGYEGTEVGWPAERNAQIYARYAGRGKGALILQTSGEDRLMIGENGELNLNTMVFEDGHGLYIPLTLNGVARKLRIE
jgi:hypothetical protein